MEKKRWKVYVHINKENGKRYYGITSKANVNHRWESGSGYKENPHFWSAIQKYGWDGFEHVVLYDDLLELEAKDLERRLIADYGTQDPSRGYNMTSGGDGTPDYHPSVETRAKLSRAKLRENLSEETLRRRSDGLRGRKFSDEHKRKIGDGNSKAVSMFTKDDAYIRTFKSARDAEVELGISHTHISQCCHGRRNTAGGYRWVFA